MRGIFFFFGGRQISRCGEWGRLFPQSQHILEDFLMPQNGPRRQGKPRGSKFPRLLHREPARSGQDTGVPPDQAGTGYLSILGIPGGPSSRVPACLYND